MRPRTLPIVAGESRSFTAFALQTKIAKIIAPSKTRVHAVEVANHNALYFMACPRAAPARAVGRKVNNCSSNYSS
jgi:hypothetical protein